MYVYIYSFDFPIIEPLLETRQNYILGNSELIPTSDQIYLA